MASTQTARIDTTRRDHHPQPGLVAPAVEEPLVSVVIACLDQAAAVSGCIAAGAAVAAEPRHGARLALTSTGMKLTSEQVIRSVQLAWRSASCRSTIALGSATPSCCR